MVLAHKGGKKKSRSFPIPSALDDGTSKTSSAVVGDSQTSLVGLVLVESPAALVVMDKEDYGEVVLCLTDGRGFSFPFGYLFPVALGDSRFSDWALHCVKDVCHAVGISCVGEGKKTLALLTAIEKEHRWEELDSLSSSKGYRELKNLECSINYDAKGASSSRGKGKAHAF